MFIVFFDYKIIEESRKLDLPLIPPLEITIMKIFCSSFLFSLKEMFLLLCIQMYQYINTPMCMHMHTHTLIHTNLFTHRVLPASFSLIHVSHTLSLSSHRNKDTHSYKCTRPLPHTCHKHVCPLQEQRLSSTCAFSHAFTHSHTQTASHTNTLFHIQLPTIDNLTHIPPRIHLCTLTHMLSQMHPHLPPTTHTYTRSLTCIPHRYTHKHTISHYLYTFTSTLTHTHLHCLSHTHINSFTFITSQAHIPSHTLTHIFH